MIDWIINYVFWIKFKQKNMVNIILSHLILNKKKNDKIGARIGSDYLLRSDPTFFFRA